MSTYLFSEKSNSSTAYLVQCKGSALSADELSRLEWLLEAQLVSEGRLPHHFIGPRREMVTPWSTNATEIARNAGISSVERIEIFRRDESEADSEFDRMLEARYDGIDQRSLLISGTPAETFAVTDLEAFNEREGLALSAEEIEFLRNGAKELGRDLTDAEVYGFAQINSEHCRHKIFGGTFVVDGVEKPSSLFDLIKETSRKSPENLVSAYKDNVAFLSGPKVSEFAPCEADRPGLFGFREIDSVISLKAETHNFPTTVEPFNGAATGGGGEIRDRMAGGRGSIPLVGTAVYITSYPRLEHENVRRWEGAVKERKWKFQTPQQILTKASNGASDFGNKFGQPLIVGSVGTFEAQTERGLYAYDRCIMLAGGVGYANRTMALKRDPKVGDKIVILGGDNYRIGMAGGSVSSVGSGQYSEAVELSAVQRSNAEMQKRVYNVIRALAEMEDNPIVSIHDHGAGGHMNCLAELVGESGGIIYLDKLPIGDPTLSAREILSNESQERMGLIVSASALSRIQAIAERERAPMYVVGEVTGSGRLVCQRVDGTAAVDLPLALLFGSSPKTTVSDSSQLFGESRAVVVPKTAEELHQALVEVLSLEAVACKDWLTNKVDRSVTGRVAQQQCVGPLQLPLANCGVVALDYVGVAGIATSIGHAASIGLLDSAEGARASIAEAVTNLVFAPIAEGLAGVSLSANWMWPAKKVGEGAALYRAVEACSNFACALGIPIPTGKDSLSMTMRYQDGTEVSAPGTVVISAAAQCEDITRVVTPDLKCDGATLMYVDLSGDSNFSLGGSVLAQTQSTLGETPPKIDALALQRGFNAVQQLLKSGLIQSGHDVSSGGLITALAEMCFGGARGAEVDVSGFGVRSVEALFCEKPSLVLEVRSEDLIAVQHHFSKNKISAMVLGRVGGSILKIRASGFVFEEDWKVLAQAWYRTSYLLDREQTNGEQAESRAQTLTSRNLRFQFPEKFEGSAKKLGAARKRAGRGAFRAAIVREKGTNGDREMAYALHAAGFDVRDVTVSDLTSGREDLSGLQFVVFPGGFSNSDVLGAGRGWAAVCRFHPQAYAAIESFMKRPDTLSLGVCNGCQFVTALGLIGSQRSAALSMHHNLSSKFESTFLSVKIEQSNSVMLKSLHGSTLGIWVAHGEGRFKLPTDRSEIEIPMRYVSSQYPMNPNGSDDNAAAVCSVDGRHLVMMPHLERAIIPWQWGYYPPERRRSDEFTPWMEAFTNAREWVRAQR